MFQMSEKDSLLIHKIEITNCGAFRGTHELEFSIDKEKNITVVMAESGRGKSTIFGLIYWCLYGEFFKPKEKITLTDEGLVHKPLLTELEVGKKVTASVILTINDRNGEKYALTRSVTATKLREENKKKFDQLNNSRINHGIQIETDCKLRMEDEAEGGLYTERDQGIINNELGQYLPKNLSDFVLFDGEKLVKFQTPENAKEIITDGIEKISGLPVVESLIRSAEHTKSEIKKITAKKAGGAEGDGLARALDTAEEDIKNAERKQGENEKALSANKILYDEIQEEMRKTKAGKNIGDRIKDVEDSLSTLKKEEKKHNQEVKDFLFKKIPELLIRETLLKSQKDFARLEELQEIPPSITSEGIDKLRNALTCVCGRGFEKDDEVWKELGRVKETIIDSDTVASISQGRGLISQIVDQSNPEKIEEQYDSLNKKSTALSRQIKLTRASREGLFEERRNLPQDGEQSYDELDKQGIKLWKEGSEIQVEIKDAKRELEEAQERWEITDKKLKELLSHGEKHQDDLYKIKILEAIVKFAKERKKQIIDILRDRTEESTNEYFMKSAPQKEEFDKVEITSKYDILALDDEGDSKELSMGQSHVLGLSYVMGCRKVTEKNSFLFIDSPLHNISGTFRNEVADVLSKHLPNVQIVLFVTESEYIQAPKKEKGELPVRDILKPSNKVWMEYEIAIGETEDGARTRCFEEMKENA